MVSVNVYVLMARAQRGPRARLLHPLSVHNLRKLGVMYSEERNWPQVPRNDMAHDGTPPNKVPPKFVRSSGLEFTSLNSVNQHN